MRVVISVVLGSTLAWAAAAPQTPGALRTTITG